MCLIITKMHVKDQNVTRSVLGYL